ncbi:TetR/AcrR family transcriptional regulator [Bacillus sp. SM2101]|uniref:TetR/AcrR family transcriptional regulator n=1 Tax=Bacillus sp. SM2101 TaxID=2805366 RepID=UPI001BDF4CA7|nr:TetR/AcrR family transcriptional regulator [Bacillus sp. SM2101]
MDKKNLPKEDAKSKIISHATSIFSQKGYAATSISDISKATGLSKSHIYYYFENKEMLFVFLAKKSMTEWREKWQRTSISFENTTEKLFGIARHVLYNFETPLLQAGREMATNDQVDPNTVQNLYTDLAAVPFETYLEIFQEGLETGEFSINNILETTMLFSSWMGGLCASIGILEFETLEKLFIEAVTIFLESIKP